MKENDQQARAIARAKGSQKYGISGRTGDSGKPATRYTFFTIALIAFLAGGWAITCLFQAISAEGLINLVKQLTSALTGR